MKEITRICLWSGPRNISTALMYAFAQRKDTKVYDEPLYAHYLSKSPAFAYHPGVDDVLNTLNHNGDKVVETMLNFDEKPVVFFKQMAHHLVEPLDWSFMKQCVNVILTRDPKEVLPSYAEQVEIPSLYDVGYKSQIEVMNYLRELGQEIIVLDAKQVLLNPKKVLTELCESINIPFEKNMLSWEAGAREEDGSWAKYWYHNVHRSTGFASYRPKTVPFPERLKPLLAECRPLYNQLSEIAIKA